MLAPCETLTSFDPSLNAARQTLYRFAALTFLDPRAGAWERLAAPQLQAACRAAAELLRAEPALAVPSLGRGELPLDDLDPDAVIARLPNTAELLNTEFERTFGLLVSGTCPPYETEYIDGKFTFQRSQHLADIAGFYRAFGLEPSHQFPERHDHLVLELEFMAFVIGLEQRASEDSRAPAEGAAICRNAQARFLNDHLAWWVPTFARLLSKELPHGFYSAAGSLLAAFLPAERALLGVEPTSAPIRPASLERPEECEGCCFSALPD
jgi:TorA maturation chaperone TorD